MTDVNWTPVSEQLPPYGKKVLVWDGYYPVVAMRTSTDVDGEHWELAGVDDDSGAWEDVSHWAELPPGPPKTAPAQPAGEDS